MSSVLYNWANIESGIEIHRRISEQTKEAIFNSTHTAGFSNLSFDFNSLRIKDLMK